MGKRDRYIEHLSQVPLFSACSKRELAMIARRATDLDIPAGRELVREGQPGYEFFVIVEGKGKVTRGDEEIAVLGPGEFFGEMALLRRAPRSATVTAATKMEALVVSVQEFRALLEEAPSLTYKVLAGLAARLHELETRPQV